MNAALVTSEYRKLATLRSTWWALLLAPMTAAVVTGVGVHLAPSTDHLMVTQAARGVAAPLWLVVTVIAILAGAGEFQHRTILSTLLAAPRRTALLGAKAVVIAVYGAVLTALGMGAAAVSSITTANFEGVPIGAGGPQAWRGVAGAILVGALFGMLASGLGVLTRSTALALTTLLLWRFVGEGVLPVIARQPGLSAWTPSGAARAIVHPSAQTLSASGGGLLLVGYCALVAVVAAWMFRHRDPA
jgi:ABC-2 type transport system permease protein